MKQNLTYKYRLYPTEPQRKEILRIAEATRQFYNKVLTEKEITFRKIGVWKRTTEAQEKLNDYSTENRVEQSTLEFAASAVDRAFRRYKQQSNSYVQYKEHAKIRAKLYPKYPLTDADLKGFPMERPMGAARVSFSLSPSLLLFQDNTVYIPQVGWVRAVFHRLPPKEATLKRCTVMSKSSGKEFLLMEISVDVEDKRPDGVPEEALGVVFVPGLLAVRSDGEPVSVRHTDPELEKQIEKAYQTLQRRTPGSKRYNEQRQRLAKLIEKQTERRRDALHKASKEIIGTGKYVGVQVPAVKSLAKQHKKEQVEKIVRDEAWYSFFSMLKYKANLTGMPLYPIPRAYPINRICAACGVELKREPKTYAWICPKCGVLCGKGGNAARNIAHYIEDEIEQWKARAQDCDR